MTIQEYMIDTTRRSAEALFKYARSVPEDKLNWSPMENGRSVLNLLQECALCPDWCYQTISGELQDWTEENEAQSRAMQAGWTTVDDCERECNQRLENLFAFFRTIRDDRLSETKFLPYDGGRDFNMVEMMEYPHWNFDYHLGQIAYIQTLYGDKDMH